MLAEDLRPQKRARNFPHYWVEQKEKRKREREREKKEVSASPFSDHWIKLVLFQSWQKKKKKKKRNQDRTSTLEREVWKRKGICTLGGHLNNKETSLDWGGTSKPQRKAQHSDWGGQSSREMYRPSVPLPGTPQPETLCQCLGAETQALEVSSQERTMFGCMETAWGG